MASRGTVAARKGPQRTAFMLQFTCAIGQNAGRRSHPTVYVDLLLAAILNLAGDPCPCGDANFRRKNEVTGGYSNSLLQPNAATANSPGR